MTLRDFIFFGIRVAHAAVVKDVEQVTSKQRAEVSGVHNCCLDAPAGELFHC